MINGAILRDAVISAANNVNNHRKAVDALNVFPVPDGDTGTNMSMTMMSASRELARLPDDATVTKVADVTSSAMLRGARGNSGVILSLIFRGIAKGLKGMEEAGPKELVVALSYGVESAYKAVMKPTEGTILTVVRLSAKAGAEFASKNKEAELADVWKSVCDGAEEALKITPDLLPVLKKAGVIDAGGQGLIYAFLGMLSVFKDGKMIEDQSAEAESKGGAKTSNRETQEIKYAYLTKFKIKKNDSSKKIAIGLRAYLESIGEDVNIVENDDDIDVSVQTDAPGNAIQEGLKYGMIISAGVENKRLENASFSTVPESDSKDASVDGNQKSQKFEPVSPTNEVGFVSVAAGEGLGQMFREIGVDIVVTGGQTMNPSTEDILNAVEATPARTVFVLPNNKNIIMAAEQVAPLSSRKVIVLPTRTIPQGISAMLQFDDGATIAENHLAMSKAIDSVQTAQVTFAARDSVMDGQEIKEGQILGMENGAITVVEDDLVSVAFKVTKHLCNRHTEIITVFYGEGATDADAEKLEKMITEKFPNVDVTVINGGQPVYHFIISVE